MIPDRFLELQLRRNVMARRESVIFPSDLLMAELNLREQLGRLTSQVADGLKDLSQTPGGGVNVVRAPHETREERAAKETALPMVEVAGNILEGADIMYRTHLDPLAFITFFDAGCAVTKAIAPLLLAIYGRDTLIELGLAQINPTKLIAAAEAKDPKKGLEQLAQFGRDLVTAEKEAKAQFVIDPTGKSLVAAYRKSLLTEKPNEKPTEGPITTFEIVGSQAIEDIYNASFDHTFRFLA